MSGISSGVGIFSGIDSKSLIDQLIAIDAQPKQLIQKRVAELQQQQAAYLDVNSALLGLKNAAGAFFTNKLFDASRATSSDSSVLSATAANSAPAGAYTFSVARLVTTQQQLSRGYADKSVSLNAGSFTFEVGGGGASSETALSELNGGSGVQRGKIILTDTTGGTNTAVTVDLSTAVTVNDVVTAINANGKVGVTASVEGDRIKLTAGAGVTSFTLASASAGRTAEDLGIAGSSSSGVITGTRVRTASTATALSVLNDGAGVNIRDGSDDIKVTTRSGTAVSLKLGEISHTVHNATDNTDTKVIDQARPATLGDLITNFNNEAKTQLGAGQLVLSLSADGSSLVVTDNTVGAGNLKIESLSGRSTAEDLGIATTGVASGTYTGQRLLSGINSRLTRSLLGGTGLSSGDITVTDRAGNSKSISVSAAALSGSVTDVINEINTKLADTGGGATAVQVKASLNRAGNGIALTDTSTGSGNVVVSGALADSLKLTTSGATSSYLDGGNLQSKWIGRATLLKNLNLGKGIGTGTIRITDTTGTVSTVEVKDTLQTVDDLLVQINGQLTTGVTAKINDSGDGIAIVDTKNGTGKLKVEDVSGTVGKSLNLVKEVAATSGTATLDGSYERSVAFDASDSLDTVVNKINAAGVGVTAAIIRDGSSGTPYRISFTARDSGSRGRTIIDTKGLDLGLSSLSKGEDAVAFFGNADPARAVLLTSSTNSLDQVVTGVNVDLKAVSTSPVTVTVTRDQPGIEKGINDFVTAFNKVLDTINKYDSYNADTNKRGILLGDNTASQVASKLRSGVQGAPTGLSGQYTRLYQVGLKIGDGAKLVFDADKFRAAYTADPQGIEDLFAASVLKPKTPVEIAPGVTVPASGKDEYTQQGVVEAISKLAGNLTNSVDGLLTQRGKTLDSQIAAQRKRSDDIDVQLAAKRARLEAQFLAMEKAIGELKTQSQSLSSIGG